MEEVRILRERTDAISDKVDDKRIDQARAKLDQASSIRADESDPETAKSAMDSILDAKKLLAKIRSDNQKEIRQIDLNRCMAFFDSHVRKYASQTDASSFDTLSKTAQRSIDSNSNDFENHLIKLRGKNFMILWRQDWFVIDRFKMFADRVYLFRDKRQHAELIRMGNEAVRKDDMEALRQVVYTLDSSRTDFNSDDDMLADANIVGG
jgi:molecular chaperone DnaK